MITSEFFHLIKYRFKMSMGKNKDFIENIIGLDSEADTKGFPFMFSFSNGITCDLKDIPQIFFTIKSIHFSTYNLKYDSGNILRFLDKKAIYELWKYGNVKYDGYYLEYIPHKFLMIQKGKIKKKIWDIAQFYKMSLDKAGKKYLDRGKIEISTKKFTKRYIEKNYNEIKEYCIKDAELCADLSNFLVEKLKEFGINTTALYSYASLSVQYFRDMGRIVDISRLYKVYPELIMYAIDSYQGGKFEVTGKGHYNNCYEYDIISAYPYQIYNLPDLRFCKIVKSKKYKKDAYYGFLRCQVINTDFKNISHGLLDKNTRIYPIGSYYCTLTKNEYDYYISIGIEIKIISAYWIFIDNPVYPYKKVIDNLFKIKYEYKKKDVTIYNLAKYIMNSFYGKTCQLITKVSRKTDTRFLDAGNAFNPIHASIITANTRLEVTKLQNILGENCLAVHTDSIMTTKEIPEQFLYNELGGFEFVDKGDTIIIACGCYQIGDTKAFKGFHPKKRGHKIDDWYSLLEKHYNDDHIKYSDLVVPSWYECSFRGNFQDINLFTNREKKIMLNADIKRRWPSYTLKGKDYLKKSFYGEHRIEVNNIKPNHWS